MVCVLAFVISGTLEAQGLFERPGRWWREAGVQRDLGLTAGQIESLEKAFHRKLKQRIALRRKLDQMDGALAKLIARGDADDSTVARLSNEVERIRAERNVSRTLMLVEMYRILTPAQRLELTEAQKASAAAQGRSAPAPVTRSVR